MSEQHPPHLLSPDEAARYLHICTSTLLAHVKDGEIAFISVGCGLKNKRRKFLIADLDAFIERRRQRETPVDRSTHRISTPEDHQEFSGISARFAAMRAEKERNARNRKSGTKTLKKNR
ncbi:helix-turn-helix domain-containing protein [Xanthobacter sp. V2C-8]|uniref:helix-turn-helix domain-containing protein n=1 Tax=Xanthobacter albus TaxID=3119929 RepID=UPI003728C8DD